MNLLSERNATPQAGKSFGSIGDSHKKNSIIFAKNRKYN